MQFPDTKSHIIFLAILAGILFTLLSGFLAIRIAWKTGMIDIPGSSAHKKHHKPTPLAGGIALVISLVPLVFLFKTVWDRQILIMLLAAAIIFVFGVWDDLKGLNAPKKLIGQLLACVVLLIAGMGVKIFKPGLFGLDYTILVWFNRAITIFWIIGVTNAFNLVDSMDGLVVGLSGWAFAFFILASVEAGQINLAIQSALMAGICMALYLYNSQDAQLFLGDSGAQTLGFILAVMAIIYTPSNRPQLSSWFVPILLVGVPIFDTSLVFFSRLRRKIPFYKANQDHTYHRLVAFGFSPNHAVLIMHETALILNCLAFVALSLEPVYSNMIFALCICCGIGLLIYLENRFEVLQRENQSP